MEKNVFSEILTYHEEEFKTLDHRGTLQIVNILEGFARATQATTSFQNVVKIMTLFVNRRWVFRGRRWSN